VLDQWALLLSLQGEVLLQVLSALRPLAAQQQVLHSQVVRQVRRMLKPQVLG
jgi:hypothetical protein